MAQNRDDLAPIRRQHGVPPAVTSCHTALVGRPTFFPQIKPAEHVPEGASCIDCHVAHDPALGGTR